jgi:hypothetical protein
MIAGIWARLTLPQYFRQSFPIASRASRPSANSLPGCASRSMMAMILRERPSMPERTMSHACTIAPASGGTPGRRPFCAMRCLARYCAHVSWRRPPSVGKPLGPGTDADTLKGAAGALACGPLEKRRGSIRWDASRRPAVNISAGRSSLDDCTLLLQGTYEMAGGNSNIGKFQPECLFR